MISLLLLCQQILLKKNDLFYFRIDILVFFTWLNKSVLENADLFSVARFEQCSPPLGGSKPANL